MAQVSKAGGVAATAQAKAGGVQAAYADSAAQRKAVRNVAKAAPEEAKAILEQAMLAYTEVGACPLPSGPLALPALPALSSPSLCLRCPVSLVCALSSRFCVRFDGFLC